MDAVPMLAMMSDVSESKQEGHINQEKGLVNVYWTNIEQCGQPVRGNVKCVTKSLPSQLYTCQAMETVGRMLAEGGGTKLQPDAKALCKLCTIKLLTQRVDI